MLAFAVVLFGVMLLGGALVRAPALPEEERWPLRLAAGLVALAVWLLLLDLLGVRWSRPLVLLPAVLAAAAVGLRWRRRTSGGRFCWRPGWGDAVALVGLAIFVAATALRWDVHPDFIFHWGIKGEKLFLDGGIDFAALAARGDGALQPDYPNLLPVLFAATATVGGSFAELPALLWSAVLMAAVLLAGRALLGRLAVSPLGREAGLATLALVLTTFGVGYLTAGGADWLIVLAVLGSTPALVGPPRRGDGVEVATFAALAAASKMEGMAFAALLLTVYLGRLAAAGGRLPALGKAVAAASPAFVVVSLWALPVWRYGLLLATHGGTLELGRFGALLPALGESLLAPSWHGAGLALFALPLVFLDPRLRAAAALLALQLAFYLAVYLSTPVDPVRLVETSATRLVFHILPTLLVLLIAALDRWSLAEPAATEGARTGSGVS